MPRPRELPAAEILQAYSTGDSARALATRYGCTAPGILKLLRREGAAVRPWGCRASPPTSVTRGAPEAEAISLHRDLENLLVFRVDQDLHHADARVSTGVPHAKARMALQEHQTAQVKPAIYLWKDELSLPGVQRMLEHRNGTDPTERIHARACEIQEIPLGAARVFYDAWHLQGACNRMEITLGLVHQGIPVAMMSFTDPKTCRGLEVPWMLQRYACSGRVPGAASRLLTAFRRGHPGAVVSYSDNRYSPTGGLYRTLGFTLKYDVGPDYRYWRDNRWYAKNAKQRKHLIKELSGIFSPEDTEYTMASRLGYKRCFDCGKKTWVLA